MSNEKERQIHSSQQLERFREKVVAARRKTGHLQKELADALGIDPQVLSRKLHGAKQAFPTHTEVKEIIRILAAWDGLSTRDEAFELLQCMDLKEESFSRQEWESAPLNRLTPEQQKPSSPPPEHPERAVFPPIPTSPTSLLGREQQINIILQLLQKPAVRLLTLRGIGGVGKTRLALEVARQAEELFADGVFFISLATITEYALIPSTLAQILHISETLTQGSQQHRVSHEERLKEFLQGKEILLVLDNVEQISGIAHFIHYLLNNLSRLKILLTSRTIVHLYGEYEFEVPPLEVSPIGASGEQPALQLFEERAHAVNSSFKVDDQNREIIAQICAHLDGLPLAIELAAVRTKLFPLSMILQRLTTKTGERLTFLRSKAQNIQPRHQTLHHTLDWSYELLTPQQQQLFRRLSVFLGGWTIEAARHVGLFEEQDEDEALEQLEVLLNHSLIQAMGGQEQLRFHFLETIREYSLEQLEARGELQKIQRSHALYYLHLVESLEDRLTGREQSVTVELLVLEQDNLRAALTWGIKEQEVEIVQRLCGALGIFWEARTQFQEAHRWIDAALTMQGESSATIRGKLLMAASRLSLWEASCERSRELAEQALALYEADNDQAGKTSATFQIGDTWHMQGEYLLAKQYLEESLLLQQAQQSWRNYGFTLSRLGAIAILQGDLGTAWNRLKEAEGYQREYSESGLLNVTLVYLGVLALMQGDLEQSRVYLREGLLLAHQTGNTYMLAIDLIAFGCVLGIQHGAVYAAKICSAAEALFASLHTALPAAYQPLYQAYLGGLQAVVGESTWAAWWREGGQLSQHEVYTLALEASTEPGQ